MDKHALELCSRLAYKPNSLGYCGKESAQKRFYSCIVNKSCQHIQEEIKKFSVLYPYIKTIAEVTGEDLYSYKVIEAYWFGNELLEKINNTHYELLIKNFRKQKIPELLVKEVEKNIPKKFIPIHLFNILHVGVGKVTMSVPFTLRSINNCMIRWGKVLSVKKNSIDAELWGLNKFSKLEKKTIQQAYSKIMVGTIKKGDNVVSHWGSIAKKVNKKEIKNISYWTSAFLE